MPLSRIIKNIGHAIKKKTSRIKTAKRKELEEIERLYSELEQKDVELEHAKAHGHRQKRDTNSIFKFWIIGAFIVYLSYLAFQTLDIIYLVGAAFIFSMVMDAPINYFSKRMPRGLSLFLAYFIMIIIIAGLLFIVLPFIFNQIGGIVTLAINKINQFKQALDSTGLIGIVNDAVWLPAALKDYLLQSLRDPAFQSQVVSGLQQNISSLVSQGTNFATNIGGFAVNIVTGVFSTIVQIGLVLTLSVLFSVEKNNVINFISRLAWSRSSSTYVKLQRLYAKLGFWLKGQLIVSGYIALMVFLLLNIVGLFGIKIPSTGSLALIAGMTNIFPYIWPILGSIPALLVAALALGWPGIIAVLIIFSITQWTENNILTPIVMNKTLGVSPLVVLLCMIIGWLVFGFIGVLFAVPIAVVVSVLADSEKKEEQHKSKKS